MNNDKYQFQFIMDQQVGLKTLAMNYARVANSNNDIRADFLDIHYANARGMNGLLTRVPGLPGSLKGTLRGVSEIKEGFGRNAKPDAVLWATWAAKFVPELVAAAPAFQVMDMTPAQMEAMGSLYGYSKRRARFMGDWKKRAVQKMYDRSARLFPYTQWIADSLMADYDVPREKIQVVPPGVDVTLYQPNEAARPNDGIVRILFVGGHFQRKGGDLLLRWINETELTTPFEVHIVTKDTDIAPSPRIIVHQNIQNNSPELVRLYQQSNIFVLPTRADCYSAVAMEAQACGVPVVISRLAGIPEIIKENETGFLMDVDDYDTMAQHLNRLVSDDILRNQFRLASHAHAQAALDCRRNMQIVLDAMKSASH